MTDGRAGAFSPKTCSITWKRARIIRTNRLIKAVKGTRDILPPSSAVWNHVEAVARDVFRTYNYHEIRTPILEETALFARGVGEETDIVSKEMYTFRRSRWQLADAAAGSHRVGDARLYRAPSGSKARASRSCTTSGPMFRRERPQKGRYRQFYQIGAEAIGSESPIGGCRSDRDGGRYSAPGRARWISVADQFGRRSELPARVSWRC